MRTDQFRYTEWRRVSDGEALAAELYDHSVDPAETRNVVGWKEYSKTAAELRKRLDGFLRRQVSRQGTKAGKRSKEDP